MSTSTPGPDPGERAGTESLGQLLSEVTRDLSQLFRQEVELAKAELKDSASNAGKSAGLYLGAAIAAHLALIFLSIAVWWALGDLIGRGWSAVIVAIFYALIAVALALAGRTKMRDVRGMPRTAETVKKIPEALKPEERR